MAAIVINFRLIKIWWRNQSCGIKTIISLIFLTLVVLLCYLSLFIRITYFPKFRIRFGGNPLQDHFFNDLHTCPACYGRDFCLQFGNGKVKFTGISSYPALHKLFDVKNVHYAEYQKKPIVLKKLAHDNEITEADKKICRLAKKGDICKVPQTLFNNVFGKGETILTVDRLKGLSDMVTCPSPRLVDRIIEYYTERKGHDMLHGEKLMLFTTLLVNPEPIILQSFPAGQGWPFPKYHGACGRWVAVEYVGDQLGAYYNKPFTLRAYLAYQLLKIADLFTENVHEFALYWTDVEYDNLAVSPDGKLKIIDAENIIVVDQKAIRKEKRIPEWNEPYISKFDECKKYGNCLSFVPETLCSHATSDFNYYAVCRDILSPYASDKEHPTGFLHDVPAELNKKHDLDNLLKECAKPTQGESRFKIAKKLIDILESMARADGYILEKKKSVME